MSLGQLSGNYANASVSNSGTARVGEVPEPSSIVLTLLGMGGVAWWRSRGEKRAGNHRT
ncbi:MAG: PEP-CTERM sorting domain-containing protein [Bryobacteraceae bacterium]